MGKPFKRKKGTLQARLSGQERRVLEHVCDELTTVLSDPTPDPDVPEWARELGLAGVGEARPAPEDPVLARLLPDAYDDPEEAGEFRRLTEAGLRATKLAHIAVVREQLGHDPIADIVEIGDAFGHQTAEFGEERGELVGRRGRGRCGRRPGGDQLARRTDPAAVLGEAGGGDENLGGRTGGM